MDERLYEDTYLPRYAAAIKALARKLARRDQELFEDLFQEGMIALWKLDPANARDNEDAWVRQALWNNMVTFLRKERPARFESLEAHLARGAQVLLGDDGEIRMLPGSGNVVRAVVKEAYGDQEDDE